MSVAMEAGADPAVFHPAPGWGAVLREQVRAVGQAVRLELLAAMGLMAAMTLVMVIDRATGGGEAHFTLVDMVWPVVLVAVFAPWAVWKGDTPSRRAYLWAMPVDRARGSLAKVLGGAAWLTVGVAGFLAWAVAASLLTGGRIGSGLQSVPGADVTLSGNPWMWLVPFAAALAAYLAGSAVALLSDHAWRWYAGLTFAGVLLLDFADETPALGRLVGAVLGGRHGFVTLMTGSPSGPVVYGGPEAAAPVLDLGAWLVAVLLWVGPALALVILAARRHQER